MLSGTLPTLVQLISHSQQTDEVYPPLHFFFYVLRLLSHCCCPLKSTKLHFNAPIGALFKNIHTENMFCVYDTRMIYRISVFRFQTALTSKPKCDIDLYNLNSIKLSSVFYLQIFHVYHI